MHILVIDDDRDIRAMLSMALAAEGHEVETAVDGVVALERLRQGRLPSLILLDMMMPRLGGEELLGVMRSNPHTADIPVVILTGQPAMGRNAAKLGAAGCLVKPIDLGDLLSAIHSAGAHPEPRA
jgi:CheY-like chemotaxis protein